MTKKRLKSRRTVASGSGAGALTARLANSRLVEQLRTPMGLGASLAGLIVVAALIYIGFNLVQQQPGAVPVVPTAGTAKPLAAVPGVERNGYFKTPPPMTIDPAKKYTAAIRTDKGDIMVQLFADKAPQTVNNFVFLARQGFYDGVTFHRVLSGFMAQGGDPLGTGTGGPGYEFADEAGALALPLDREGVLAMANSGPNTNGSQFFITFGPATHLNGKHAVFGQVVQGMEVLRQIRLRDPDDPAQAAEPGDVIGTIDILEQ